MTQDLPEDLPQVLRKTNITMERSLGDIIVADTSHWTTNQITRKGCSKWRTQTSNTEKRLITLFEQHCDIIKYVQ
jgi:hypothetical protein